MTDDEESAEMGFRIFKNGLENSASANDPVLIFVLGLILSILELKGFKFNPSNVGNLILEKIQKQGEK